jgi:uncharacterized repeat protein (TIGR03803 family)
MRRKSFWIAATCILSAATLLPAFSSGASPTSKEKVLYSFTGGSDGGYPISDLTLDSAGNLYGTTAWGGTGTACGKNGCGTVFELKRTSDGWKEEVLHNFLGGLDGSGASGGVIFDKAGNLYGATASGPVYKLAPNSHGGWTEHLIYDFNFYSGGSPAFDLAFDNQGNLYGAIPLGVSGGKSCADEGCGAVFELTPQSDGSWTETTIHIFTDGDDGATPSSGVILDAAGNVYGLTQYGGTGSCRVFPAAGPISGCGVLYKFTPNPDGNWTETVIYNFVRGGGFGIYPSGSVYFDNGNHLFGVTQAGGDGLGTVFELQDTRKRGWQEGEPHIFYAKPDGVHPTGRLVADEKGDLFGVTSQGGANGTGIVFELERLKNGWTERILHTFGSSGSGDGQNPDVGLVLDAQGRLYGTTGTGGTGTACSGGCGTVYEVMP